MAIAYLRVTFPRLLLEAGAQKLLAYLGRYNIFDHHAGCHFRFAEIAADLVYQAVVLPVNAPAELADPAALARAIDAAESKRMRKQNARQRWPQIGAAFVAALPPDTELTYDEVVELMHRLAEYIRRDVAIAIHLAIHDPARESPGATNRHGHLLATTRTMNALGFSAKKLREFLARPRHADGKTYVAEGLNWPRIYAKILTAYFVELGLDLIVAPHLPIGHRHWPKSVLRTEPERVAKHRQKVDELNEAIIFGPAKALVESLLRGRSTLPISSIQRLLPHFIDNEGQRDDRLSEILADPQLVTLAIHPGDRRPSRVTTRAIHDLVQDAVATVARAQRTGGALLVAVSRTNVDEVTADLVDRIRQQLPQRLILAGQIHSHCATLADKIAGVEHAIVTVKQLVSSANPSPSDDLEIAAGDLIVLPRAEQTDDQWVAALIVAAADRGAQLILGYDQSFESGVASNRLAAAIAETLAPPAAILLDYAYIERELRCGRVERAITSLAQLGVLQFVHADPRNDSSNDFFVSDDEREVARAALNFTTANGDGLEHGPHTLAAGQWIAFTRTDYSTVPPDLRAGRLARIAFILPAGRRIVIQHPDERLQEVDLAKFPHVRPAPVITLRESRHAPKNARLIIRLTKPKRAWSCLLMAAARGNSTSIQIDPAVASNAAELIQVVQRSLPSALPTELTACADPDADIMDVLTQVGATESSIAPSSLPDSTSEIEEFPMPGTGQAQALATDMALDQLASGPAQQHLIDDASLETIRAMPQWFSRNEYIGSIRTRIPRHALHEKMWTVLASTLYGQAAVDRLEQLCERKDVGEIYDRLVALDFWNDQGPTAALFRAAITSIQQAPLPDQTPEDEIDNPRGLQKYLPRDWQSWDLYLFSLDVRTFAYNSPIWREAVDPSASPEPEPV